MGVPIEEQETVIQFNRDESFCTIYTTDRTVMTRLDKLYRCIKEDTNEGEVVAKHYRASKKLISFRTDMNYTPNYEPKRKMSEEHIQRMRDARRQTDGE